MGSPEISIIVPVHGRVALAERAIASALVQDVDLELVVVDDGSPAPFTMQHERVRVVRLERNQGAAAARNAGADDAKADWLAFLDSDDVWPQGALRPRLEAARAATDAENTIWAAAFVDVWPDRARAAPRCPRPSANPRDFASGCWMCPGSTALLSRAAWERSGGQDASLRRLEDYEWLLRWGVNGGHLDVYPSVAAEITRGGRAMAETIEVAAAAIRAKHATLPPPLLRRMESYLQLECAAARLHQGDIARGAVALARSWLLHPRLQVAIEPFWTT